jgi:hypothetical protein
MTSIAEIGKQVVAIVAGLSRAGGPIPAENGYVRKSVIRKLILACPHARSADDWGKVSRVDLQSWSPDAAGVLGEFPASATADSISSLLFGRPDWGLLVSMWACLWKPTLPILAKAGWDATGIGPEQADAIGRAAVALHAATGSEITPAAAVRKWLAAEGSDSTSTNGPRVTAGHGAARHEPASRTNASPKG